MPKTAKNKKATKASAQDIEALRQRGIADIVPEALFMKKLKSGERMRIYLGVDPTGPDVHVGHAVVLRALRRLQDLGHEIIFLCGDFTARIGDPTDRSAMRTVMTDEEIKENMQTYKKQLSKILDFSSSHPNPVQLKFNAQWLAKLKFQDVIELASHFTVQQMLERDMFEDRIEKGKPIYVNEFMYPLMQGYDSVAMEVDAEVGGTDQLFNMLAGRTLLKEMKNKEKAVVTFELLEGLDGRKMSKSYENVIGVMDEPNDMYGKVMAMDDALISRYFRLCTDIPLGEIKKIEEQLSGDANPRDIKMQLAREVVTIYHSEKKAAQAEQEFKQVFQAKGKPTDIPEHTVSTSSIAAVELIIEVGFASSKSEARRLIEQGGVRVDDTRVEAIDAVVEVSGGEVLQVGKRKFVTLVSS